MEMHLICKMFDFCFHGNHSHNLSLKYYLVVSLIISNVKKIISVNTLKRSWNILQKCICLVFAEKTKEWDKKHFFQEI